MRAATDPADLAAGLVDASTSRPSWFSASAISLGAAATGVNSRIQERGARIGRPQNWAAKRTSPSQRFLMWSTP